MNWVATNGFNYPGFLESIIFGQAGVRGLFILGSDVIG
jgi:hypothetical protein